MVTIRNHNFSNKKIGKYLAIFIFGMILLAGGNGPGPLVFMIYWGFWIGRWTANLKLIQKQKPVVQPIVKRKVVGTPKPKNKSDGQPEERGDSSPQTASSGPQSSEGGQ